MAFFRTKRTVPSPEPMVSHGSSNPMFVSTAERLSVLRSVVLWSLSTVAIGAAIGVWVYGPYFHITNITVRGTKVVQAESVRDWVAYTIHRSSWFIIPQDHSVMISTKSLASRLQREINTRISVESVIITIPDRHSLVIDIVERKAVLVWTSGDVQTTMDTYGVIIGPLLPNESAPYPRVEDQTLLPTATDSTVASPELVKGFTTLSEEAKAIGLSVDRFILPIPRCVISNTETNSDQDTNESQNKNTENNSNVPTVKNIPLNANAPDPKNSNSNSGVDLTIGTCQNDTARLNASDIWLQVSKGPVIYFDRHQDLHQAMDAVRRAFEDPKNRTVRYIDARFPGRLYIQ